MTEVVLGRRLLTPSTASLVGKDVNDPLTLQIQQNDRFFCQTMELIPAQYYFPTDEEENWLKSGPKGAKKKYHRVCTIVYLILFHNQVYSYCIIGCIGTKTTIILEKLDQTDKIQS